VKPWESSYACFANNPIWYSDVNGDDGTQTGSGNGYMTGDLNNVVVRSSKLDPDKKDDKDDKEDDGKKSSGGGGGGAAAGGGPNSKHSVGADQLKKYSPLLQAQGFGIADNGGGSGGAGGGVGSGGGGGNAPWMDFALSQLGQRELNPGNNPNIVGYHATTGGFKDDETPWCSSFVNWSMSQAGIIGTNSARAFSWQSWGQGIDKPAYGAIVVMKYSHVGFVAGINKDGRLILLGGNQGSPGSVNFSPNLMNAVISYRYPKGFTPNYKLPFYNLNGRSLNLNSTR
jgi:uncharacterized protein (TIGR02594 family)